MTAVELALQTIRGWVGQRNTVIDIYNSFLPHPRGYKVKYDDQACATIVSAIFIQNEWTDIVPPECAAWLLFKNMDAIGCGTLDGNRTPDPGDLIFFGVGNSYRNIDHVGIVDEVKPDGRIYFFDIRTTVARHSYKVGVKNDIKNYGYIIGYGIPNYASKDVPDPTPMQVFKVGDLVTVNPGAKWYNGASIKASVFDDKWYISSVRGDRAVLGMNLAETRNICSPIHTSDITIVNENNDEQKVGLTAVVNWSTMTLLETLSVQQGKTIGEVIDGIVEGLR